VLFDVQPSDFATIGILIVLEGLLSADNALVMAVMVLGLPRHQRRSALSYGLVGAFVFRIAATLLAIHLVRILWVKLAGAVYLLYLVYTHFGRRRDERDRHAPPPAGAWLGLPAFWATMLRVELMNLAFSIDSILVAVAMSTKGWVVITGGLLGIVAMRLVVGQLLALIQKYPALVDGAFVIITWVGLKLLAEYAYAMDWIDWEIPRAVSLGGIALIFLVAFLYARQHPAKPDDAGAR
jgi:YkoY family integral membrane protein